MISQALARSSISKAQRLPRRWPNVLKGEWEPYDDGCEYIITGLNDHSARRLWRDSLDHAGCVVDRDFTLEDITYPSGTLIFQGASISLDPYWGSWDMQFDFSLIPDLDPSMYIETNIIEGLT